MIMICPFCSHDDSKVIDSRSAGAGIRRRRKCLRCAFRFTTHEGIQTRIMQVIKRDGRREEFAREKLWHSLTKACTKRPLPVGSVEKVIDEIESHLENMGRAEMQSKVIGELVIEKLKALDRVAYIRFASVYRDFRDIESFKEEIDTLLQARESSSIPVNQLSFSDAIKKDLVSLSPRRRGRKPKTKPIV